MSFLEPALSQFIRVFDADTDYARWQSYYKDTVVLDDKEWVSLPFTCEGITAGDATSEAGLTVGVPMLSTTIPVIRAARRFGHLVEVTQYEFDPNLGNDAPQAGQIMLARYVGEVVGAKGRHTQVELELGSTLAPVGIQVPPRTFTSQLVGVPAQL